MNSAGEREAEGRRRRRWAGWEVEVVRGRLGDVEGESGSGSGQSLARKAGRGRALRRSRRLGGEGMIEAGGGGKRVVVVVVVVVKEEGKGGGVEVGGCRRVRRDYTTLV